MIVVKIELWPHGDESTAREIGRLRIANDGTGDAKYGNYEVEADHAGIYYGQRKNPWKTGRVVRFHRNLSPYRLLCRALRAIKEL